MDYNVVLKILTAGFYMNRHRGRSALLLFANFKFCCCEFAKVFGYSALSLAEMIQKNLRR
jgi:hypothetical protein